MSEMAAVVRDAASSKLHQTAIPSLDMRTARSLHNVIFSLPRTIRFMKPSQIWSAAEITQHPDAISPL